MWGTGWSGSEARSKGPFVPSEVAEFLEGLEEWKASGNFGAGEVFCGGPLAHFGSDFGDEVLGESDDAVGVGDE